MIKVRWLKSGTQQKIPLNILSLELDTLGKHYPLQSLSGPTSALAVSHIFSISSVQKACIQLSRSLLSPKCLLGLKYKINYFWSW